jgi:hypothetical protein
MHWIIKGAGAALGIVVLGAQLVPYGRAHTNPPVTAEPAWNSPETRALVERACFDCHSNQTRWPWYASIAPLSWSVQDHVDEGRSKLNFSTWDQPQREAHEAIEVIEEGEMPLESYTWLHAEARLTDAERAALIAGLEATLTASPPIRAKSSEGGEGGERRSAGLRHDDDDDDDRYEDD